MKVAPPSTAAGSPTASNLFDDINIGVGTAWARRG
jgi:hypothetical protein